MVTVSQQYCNYYSTGIVLCVINKMDGIKCYAHCLHFVNVVTFLGKDKFNTEAKFMH